MSLGPFLGRDHCRTQMSYQPLYHILDITALAPVQSVSLQSSSSGRGPSAQHAVEGKQRMTQAVGQGSAEFDRPWGLVPGMPTRSRHPPPVVPSWLRGGGGKNGLKALGFLGGVPVWPYAPNTTVPLCCWTYCCPPS